MSTSKIISFLERLEDLIPSLPSEDAPGLLEALVSVGDELDSMHHNPPGNIFGMPVMIDRSVIRLLDRIDPSEKERVLLQAINTAGGVSTPAHVVSHYTSEHGEHRERALPENERTFGIEAIERLKESVVTKIGEAAEKGELIRSPNLLYVLYRWRDWAGEDAPSTWVQRVISESDENLLKFLGAISVEHYSQNLGDAIGSTELRVSPRWLKDFVDLDLIRPRVEKLAETDKYAAALVEALKMVDRGLDPDDPIAFYRRDT